MAKVKSSGLRNYVGRLAGNVYYINKGQNIARELAPQVANPQTEAQMDQRIKLSNVVAMYRLNSGWMKDHAFPNRPQNQSIYNAFVAANLAGSEVALTKEDAARGYCVVAPYEITKGSLPRVQLLETNDPSTVGCSLVSTFASLTSKTLGELSLDLIEQNSFLRDGDQLSFIVNFQYNDVAGIRAACSAYELTLDTTSEEAIANLPIGDILTMQEGAASGTYNLAFAVDDISAYASSVYYGAAVIISRKQSSGIQVSPATLALYGDDRFYTTMTSEARKRLARNSYGVSVEPFLVPGEGGSGDTPTPTPTAPVEFDFEFPTSVRGISTKHITLTNGMGGTEGLEYLKEHLTFYISEGGTLSIAVGTEQSGDTYYYLTDGFDVFNIFSYGAQTNVYQLSTVDFGPTIAKPLWDGEEF